MNHPSELVIHQFMTNAVNGKSNMSEATINQVAEDIKEALHRQFGSKTKRREFKLRMSNIGKPTCQLWYEKNKPEKAMAKSNNFMMNMMLGDIVEAVFKGILTEAGVKYENSKSVTLNCDNTDITGTYDLVIDGAVDDIKSASDWSYRNKFESFETLNSDDGFGYVGQLAGYAKASGKKTGGWWVVNKAKGDFKYIPATGLNVDKEISKIKNTIKIVNSNVFKRCFEPEQETFRGKPTGNTVLNKNCIFCDFRHDCWKGLKELPAVMSKAQFPKIVSYVKLAKEYVNE
tara:strand:- start:13859 stop:14722 length:864 start_codon:yes stop_codon:yes gene_type:complete